MALSPTQRRLTMWAAGISTPAWLVLAGLVAFAGLGWLPALTGALIVMALVAIFVVPRLNDLDRFATFAESLLVDVDAPAPEFHHSETAARGVRAILGLRQLWTDRQGHVETLASTQQLIIDGLPDPLLLLDANRRVRGANAAARELLGVDNVGTDTRTNRVVADRDLASIIRDPKLLETVDASLLRHESGTAELVMSNPVQRTFRALIEPLPATGDGGIALIISLSDQTEMRKIERMRADFVANASHELRTPLAAVLGFIETLQGPAKDDEAARTEFLAIMHRQAGRMARLIDDLLSLSRIELREHAKPLDAVDVINTLRGVVELLQPEAAKNGNRIVINAPPDLPLALGDHGELGQVFTNLLANALKYGGQNQPVDVTFELAHERPLSMPGSGPCLKIAVRDHGEGIAREHIPRLTERFYRVDNARSRQLGGTGLGLAIVKHITSRHRGALTIDSVEGEGSTFTVWLPVAPAHMIPSTGK